MSIPPYLTSPALAHPTIAHGFFGRQGGVSTGIFTSLNIGLGSGDDPAAVQENRERVRRALGATHLQTLYQIHSAEVLTITAPLENRPEADGMVTNIPGIGLGVLAADCNPVLLADAEAGVIGACHAGWKGAVGGVTLNTIAAMKKLGAKNITAVLGPAIQQMGYEVSAEFLAPFIAQDAANARFFIEKPNGKFLCDLPGYLEQQLIEAGVTVDRLQEDTYSQPERYFSFRRTTHAGEPDYGRQVSAIVLK